MKNPYKICPFFEDENWRLRFVSEADAPELLRVYSDEKAVPLFNSDNCHGDDFHYTTMEQMKKAIAFWDFSYKEKFFIRWTVLKRESVKISSRTEHTCQAALPASSDCTSGATAVGTIELFHRDADDYFTNCGILRLDLRSDFEQKETIFEVLSLIVPSAFDLFDCRMIATKAPRFADERIEALGTLGFSATEESLIGGEDGKAYTDYYVLKR